MLFFWAAHAVAFSKGIRIVDMQWLEDVLVLLEERNLTRAAALRNITQSGAVNLMRTRIKLPA